jgi:hypothetical protein
MGRGTAVSGRWRTIALVAVGVALGVTLAAPPVSSHVGGSVNHLWSAHIRPKADARYHTKRAADARYHTKAVADARYAAAGHNHDGRYADAGHNHDGRYYAAGSKVGDADTLDTLDSAAFLRVGATAGGDLTGTYPAPTLTASSVASAEIADNTLSADDAFRLAGTVAVDLPSIAANTCGTQNVTIPGRLPGDLVMLFPSPNLASVDVVVQPLRSVSMSGESHIFGVCNVGATAADPPSGTWGYLLARF